MPPLSTICSKPSRRTSPSLIEFVVIKDAIPSGFNRLNIRRTKKTTRSLKPVGAKAYFTYSQNSYP